MNRRSFHGPPQFVGKSLKVLGSKYDQVGRAHFGAGVLGTTVAVAAGAIA